jgi:hypothetical protein
MPQWFNASNVSGKPLQLHTGEFASAIGENPKGNNGIPRHNGTVRDFEA